MTASLPTRRRPHPSPTAVATALAHAFLSAGSWESASLITTGASVLGAKRRWLAPLVREVLAAHHRAPHDAPRGLAAVIEGADAFRGALERARQRGTHLSIHHHAVTAGSVADRSVAALPRLDTVADLASLLGLTIGQLEWYADTKNWNRRTPAGPLQNYRYEWRARAGRVPRLLEIPEQRLRRVQRALVHEVLGLIPLREAAHGFVPGRSAATGAALHTGSEIVIALDLVTFFARVEARRIYGTLRQAGIPEACAHLITGMCTNAVPPRVIAAMPPGGSPEERFALRKALASNHLPQGAPSSPTLANLAVRRLDSRLGGWARASGATYTRYADDLAFSATGTEAAIVRRADAFIRGVRRIVDDEGHAVNPRKTRVRRAGVRQTVTGIVVNEHPNVTRGDYERLKAILHNCGVHGPASQNRSGHDDLRAHLQGRIAWVESLNPARGRRLREQFARIDWSHS